jgi:hypothetical protein
VIGERCPKCGALLLSKNAVGRYIKHELDTKGCKVRAWEREAREQDLVRVTGDRLEVILNAGIPIKYGPVWHPHSGDNNRMSFSTGAFIPKWTHYLSELGSLDGVGGLGWGTLLTRAYARARKDTVFAAAICTIGDLSETYSARRSALAALLRAELRD